jgi:hypothetical protein
MNLANFNHPYLKKGLKAVLSIGLIIYLIYSIGITELISHIQTTNPVLFAGGVIAGIIAIGISAWKWHYLLLSNNHKISFWIVLECYYIGAFSNLFLPSIAGGDVIKGKALATKTGITTESYSSIFIERFTGLFSLLFLSLLGFVFEITARGSLDLAVGTASLFLVGMLFIFFTTPGYQLSTGILRIFPNFIRLKSKPVLNSILKYRTQPRVLLGAFTVSFMFQSLNILQHYLIANAIGIDIQLAFLLVFVPVYQMILLIPISINGHGLREGIFVVLLTPVGVLESEALIFGVLAGAASLLSAAVGAIYFIKPDS